jgi:hypothetical protein
MEGSIDTAAFQQELCTFLKLGTISDVVRHIKEHQSAMLMSEECWEVSGSICSPAILVASDYVGQAISAPDTCGTILESIQERATKAITWTEAVFLAEAYFLIKNRRDAVMGAKDRLESFQTALLGFMDSLPQRHRDARVLLDTCLEFPKLRDKALTDGTTLDAPVWSGFKQSLLYAKYAVQASVLDVLLKVERLSFLNCWINCNNDLTPLIDELNKRHLLFLTVSMEMTSLYRTFAKVPIVKGGLEDLVFDGIKPWPFHPVFGLENATALEIEQLRGEKTNPIGRFADAMLSARLTGPCKVCYKGRAVLICGKCEEFVWCEKCRGSGSVCPKCGSVA